MYELWRNIFYALLAELFIVLISLLAKENKRRQVLILAVGTTIVGIFGFCPSLPPPIATKTPVFYTATAVNTSVTHVPAVTIRLYLHRKLQSYYILTILIQIL